MAEGHLSLAQLASHDPQARAWSPGGRARYCCPLPDCQGKKVDAAHRTLTVYPEGGWVCARCGAKGKLVDTWEERPAVKVNTPRTYQRSGFTSMSGNGEPVRSPERVPRDPGAETTGYDFAAELRSVAKLDGTVAAEYLASRGILPVVAHASGVRFSPTLGSTVWVLGKDGERRAMSGAPAVVFPLRGDNGRIAGIQGRVPGPGGFWKDGPNKRTFKADSDAEAGVFAAPVDAFSRAWLAIVEAPIDGVSLHLCGLATVATVGTSCPAWLLDRLAFRTVFLAHDADEAGEKAADRIAPELRAIGGRPVRLRPPVGCKDWNDALQRYGADRLGMAVRDTIAPFVRNEASAGDVAQIGLFPAEYKDPYEDP